MSEMIEVKLAKVVNIRQEIFGKLDGFNIKTRLTRHSALEQLKLNQRVQYVLLVDSSPVPADRLIEAGMIKPCKRKTRKGIKGRWYIVPKDQAFISLVPAPPSHKANLTWPPTQKCRLNSPRRFARASIIPGRPGYMHCLMPALSRTPTASPGWSCFIEQAVCRTAISLEYCSTDKRFCGDLSSPATSTRPALRMSRPAIRDCIWPAPDKFRPPTSKCCWRRAPTP